MRRLLLTLFLILGFAGLATAQTYTTVTATVVDPNGTIYILGSYTVSLINNTGQQALLNGNANFQKTYSGLTLTSAGAMSISLPSVTAMTPTGLQWQFNVCANPQQIAAVFPLPALPCFSYTSTGTQVSGSSVNLSASFTAVSPVIPVVASAGTQTNPSGIGACIQGCFNVKTYGAKGDAKKSKNVTTTNLGSNLVDTTNSPFLSTDVGKLVFCTDSNVGNALSVTIATISAYTSATTVSVAPATGNGNAGANTICTWFTQKETSAFTAAYNAAAAPLKSQDPNYATPTLALPGNVYCPPGGYVVDGPFFVQNSASGNTNPVNFIGAGRNTCMIYLSPDLATATVAAGIASVQTDGFVLYGFTIDGGNFPFSGPTVPLILFSVANQVHAYDFNVVNYGSTGDATGVMQILNSNSGIYENIIMQGSGDHGPMMACNNSTGLTFIQGLFSNGITPNMSFSSCGSRTGNGGQVNLVGTVIDESGGAFPLTIGTSSFINLEGVTLFGGSTGSMSVDGTSSAWLTDTNIGQFNSSNNAPEAISIASGGYVQATGTHIRANGTGVAVNGPAGAIFVDSGGNTYQTGTLTTFTNITPAQYATLGFTGGIIPKSSLTHTPNTCYAVTGNLLATSQNLCSFVLDQNYQLLSIYTAQGGNSPPTTSCTGAPVVTITDGTRSSTQTLTTANTSWSTTGLSTVFASGATLTVSIAANTCATPPQDVYVNVILQSVLNQ